MISLKKQDTLKKKQRQAKKQFLGSKTGDRDKSCCLILNNPKHYLLNGTNN